MNFHRIVDHQFLIQVILNHLLDFHLRQFRKIELVLSQYEARDLPCIIFIVILALRFDLIELVFP